MSDDDTQELDLDPFSEDNLRVSQFILTARIYDVLLGIYTHMEPEKAKDLLELHADGALLGPQPAFNGQFITDMMNLDEDTPDS